MVPQNDYYYDLSNKEDVTWQASLSKESGVYGWGIYHYWFNNETNLLTKPAEIIYENADIDINYFYAWDNGNWKRSWSNVKGGNAWAPAMENTKEHKGPEILVPYILGVEPDWRNHYDYLLPYFRDVRYIKKDNCPLFTIFHYSQEIEQMCFCWNKWAKEDGFDGIHFIFRYSKSEEVKGDFTYFKYEPIYSGWSNLSLKDRILLKFRKIINRCELNTYTYDSVWKSILRNAKKDVSSCMYHGAFVSYDDSPRRGLRGIEVTEANAQKFSMYFKQLIDISAEQGKEFIFLTAWNEWGEGAYLEPDKSNGNSYLQALKRVLIDEKNSTNKGF